jgi:glycosyltransferase involved in cell wall biosynthesis
MTKIRVLQVASGAVWGGVENWLIEVLRQIDRDRFQVDVLSQTPNSPVYGDEVLGLGSKVIPCPDHRRPWRYARNFRQALRGEAPYDILHTHVGQYNGFVLRLARQAGIPVRIAHSHVDVRHMEADAGALWRPYYALMRRWMSKHATLRLACSRAAASLFGDGWEAGPDSRVLYYGIDLTPFRKRVGSEALRASLGLPPGAFVLGNAARFTEQKNHRFLVRIAAEVFRREPRAYLLLLGDGPLRPAVEEQAAQAGVRDRVIFAGERRDVPDYLLGAMDVFVMPSLYEGLPVAGIEALAAGLPRVCADTISLEGERIPELVWRHSLSDPPETWAKTILAVRDSPPKVSRSQALEIMEQSPFNIKASVRAVEQLYTDAVRRG